MAYSAIPDANITNGSPLRDVDLFLLRDNPIAIAAGDTGAPRVNTLGLNNGNVSAGTTEAWRLFGDATAEASTSVTAYILSSASAYLNSTTASIGIRVLASGVITVSLDQKRSTSNNVFSRVLLNGVLDTEWTTASLTFVTRTTDITVQYGDVIVIQNRGDGGAVEWRNVKITADKKFWCNSADGV